LAENFPGKKTEKRPKISKGPTEKKTKISKKYQKIALFASSAPFVSLGCALDCNYDFTGIQA